MPSIVLLDTCAIIWMVAGKRLALPAMAAIRAAAGGGGVLISPVSIWEIGMLSRPRDGRPALMQFAPSPAVWVAHLMSGRGVRPAMFSADIALDAALLPGELHKDPADRMLVATARALRCPLVTRDHRILAYAEAGYVEAIAC